MRLFWRIFYTIQCQMTKLRWNHKYFSIFDSQWDFYQSYPSILFPYSVSQKNDELKLSSGKRRRGREQEWCKSGTSSSALRQILCCHNFYSCFFSFSLVAKNASNYLWVPSLAQLVFISAKTGERHWWIGLLQKKLSKKLLNHMKMKKREFLLSQEPIDVRIWQMRRETLLHHLLLPQTLKSSHSHDYMWFRRGHKEFHASTFLSF